jgi:hypothetical protein
MSAGLVRLTPKTPNPQRFAVSGDWQARRIGEAGRPMQLSLFLLYCRAEGLATECDWDSGKSHSEE